MEEARDQVAGHEHLGQILRVLVLAEPDRQVVLVEVLPEVRDGFGGRVFVRVDALEFVHVERRLGHLGEGIFLFGLVGEVLFLFSIVGFGGFLGWFGGLLRGLLLLRWLLLLTLGTVVGGLRHVLGPALRLSGLGLLRNFGVFLGYKSQLVTQRP